jgi:hypothetical protein
MSAASRPPGQSDERAQLIDRILASQYFENAGRLRAFLRYVADRALAEPDAEIHEYEIAERVFLRDPKTQQVDDTLVRVQASQLRKRLKQYFAGDGAKEVWRVEIPNRNYAPVFRKRTEAETLSALTASGATSASSTEVKLRRWIWTLAFGTGALLLCSVWLSVQYRKLATAPGPVQPPKYVRLFWSQLFRPGQRTQIVMGDANLSLFQDIIGHSIGVSEYASGRWKVAEDRAHRAPSSQIARMVTDRRFTSFADAVMAHRFLAMDSISVGQIVFSREFQARNLLSDNVVFFGGKRSIAWVELLEPSVNFRFRYDAAPATIVIENRSPQRDEPREYVVHDLGNGIEQGYCLITFMPNSGRTGAVLNIAGTEMEGSEAGGEFITNDVWLGRFAETIQLKGQDRFPWFQLLLKTIKVGGTSPRFEIVTYRLYRL